MITKSLIKILFLLLLALSLGAYESLAQTLFISVSPAEPLQGEPFMANIDGVPLSSIRKVTFNGKNIGVFMYQGKTTAFVGIDLNQKPGTYEFVVELIGGQTIKKMINALERKKVEAPLGIPDKLGGNTPQAQTALVNTLALENKSLENIRTGTKAFWTTRFIAPVRNPVIVDHYGYSRKTGSYNIAHKGTDYKASVGTPVIAMNRGVVRIARTYRNYGQTIVVDHGLGLQTFYMHLSRTRVNVGELVQKGQVIGLSGQTGYATGPHLHLTVRINGTSIDPVKFLDFFK